MGFLLDAVASRVSNIGDLGASGSNNKGYLWHQYDKSKEHPKQHNLMYWYFCYLVDLPVFACQTCLFCSLPWPDSVCML
ncbi:hypothetical protein EXN66_Car002408 [Channa argus]|uniref:Uncharacterized protein n=1 Tax=Channa argus TaxID=215402 RepID=A0A6G1P9M0_CHAAH|nr:hypothetical protein EXN66_Car002408 [Channa argus]